MSYSSSFNACSQRNGTAPMRNASYYRRAVYGNRARSPRP